MKKFLNIIKRFCERGWVKLILVYLFFGIFSSLIYLSLGNVASLDDPLFHIKFAEKIRNEGLGAFNNFQSLYFTDIARENSYYIYYNFLFYLVLIPFTFLNPLIMGIKVFGIIFLSLAFSLMYYFLQKMGEKKAFFWTLFFFMFFNTGLILRFIVARPFTIAPALLLLLVYFLYKKNYIGIFVLSFSYFFWHTMTFFFVPFIVIVYVMFENFYKKKHSWMSLISALGGSSFALLITLAFTTGFFEYLKVIYFGVIYDTIIGKKVLIPEGGEVYPAEIYSFIKGNIEIFILFVVSITLEIYRYISNKKGKFLNEFNDEKNVIRGTLFFLSIFFVGASLLSARNMDFFIFFSSVYIAMNMNWVGKSIEIKDGLVKKSLPFSIAIIFVYIFVTTGLTMQGNLSNTGPYDRYREASEWLKDNTSKGSVIFHTSWSIFPQLYHFNSDSNYIIGLEPRFLFEHDPELYFKWSNISTNGFVCAQEKCQDLIDKQDQLEKDESLKEDWYKNHGDEIAQAIVEDFKSHYIILSSGDKKLLEIVDNNKSFEKVFSDDQYSEVFVYKIK